MSHDAKQVRLTSNVHRSLHDATDSGKRAAYVNIPRSLSQEAKKAGYTCYAHPFLSHETRQSRNTSNISRSLSHEAKQVHYISNITRSLRHEERQ